MRSSWAKRWGSIRILAADYGRLASELFRAVRLVVDTGLHSKGWTREQAVDFFRKEDCIDEPMIQAEVDRYIDTPGQALSYKLGQLKFRELRARAQQELGSKFDLRAFHDEMLSGGRHPYHNGKELQLDSGIPLGVMAGASYAETHLRLAPGDTLTFLSDGVVEAKTATGELFGFERTQAISSESAWNIAEAARRFGQEDDITVLRLSMSPAAVLAG